VIVVGAGDVARADLGLPALAAMMGGLGIVAGAPLKVGKHPIPAFAPEAVELAAEEGFVIHDVPLPFKLD
jgi:hypothetical protein